MLGWGYPPNITGGLDVHVGELFSGLRDEFDVDAKLVLPAELAPEDEPGLEGVETGADELASELEELSSEFVSAEDRLATTETRLHRIARVVLELKQHTDRTAGSGEALNELRRTANRNGTTAADCDSCGEHLRIGLLTEAACPECGQEFDDIEQPSSILGRFKNPRLIGPTPAAAESEPEPEDE